VTFQNKLLDKRLRFVPLPTLKLENITSELGAKWDSDTTKIIEVEGQRTLNIGIKHIILWLGSIT